MQFITAIIPLLILPHILRYWGGEIYGIFILALSVQAFSYILNSAIHITLMKYISEAYALKDEGRLNSIVNDFWVIAFLNNFIVFFAIILIGAFGLGWMNISPALMETAKNVFYVTGAFGILAGCFGSPDGIIVGMQKIHENNIFRLIESVGKIIAIIVVLKWKLSLVFYVFCISMLPVVVKIIQVFYIRKLIPALTFNPVKYFDFKELKILAKYSSYQIMNQVGDILMYTTDKLIIQKIMGAASVTLYEVANKPNLFFERFISLPLSALLPACSEAYAKRDMKFINTVLLKGTRMYLLLVLPVIFSCIIYMKAIFSFWLGAEYGHAAFCAQLFLASYLVAAPFKIFSHVMISKGPVKEYAFSKFIYALINIPLSIWGVMKFGIMGGILVTLGFWVFVYSPMNIYIMIREKFNVMTFLYKIAPFYVLLSCQLLAAKLCLAVLPAHNLFQLLVNIGFIISFYIIISFFFLLDSSERKLLIS